MRKQQLPKKQSASGQHRYAAARQISLSVQLVSVRAAALASSGLCLPLPSAKYGGFATTRSNSPERKCSFTRRISPTTTLPRPERPFAVRLSLAASAASGFISSPVMQSLASRLKSSSGKMPEPQPRSIPFRREPIFTKSASRTESVPSLKCSDWRNFGPPSQSDTKSFIASFYRTEISPSTNFIGRK